MGVVFKVLCETFWWGWGLGCLKYYVKFFGGWGGWGGGGLKLKDLLVRFVVVKEIHIVCILITARCSMIVHFLNKVLYKKKGNGIMFKSDDHSSQSSQIFKTNN